MTNAPLSNARFRVTDSSGAVVGNSNGEYVTDENGEILVPDVKPGSYVITEIEAPEHYIDADSKQPLKGAKFTIYRMDGGALGTYETNGDGVIIIDALDTGWYKAAETKAPDGYLIDDTPQDFQITSGQFIKLTFENRRLASRRLSHCPWVGTL